LRVEKNLITILHQFRDKTAHVPEFFEESCRQERTKPRTESYFSWSFIEAAEGVVYGQQIDLFRTAQLLTQYALGFQVELLKNQ
jgi:hypothetical protein